jgi:glutathione S-transferase
MMETGMDLYFAPLSCSMASRIAFYEAGINAKFHQVVLSTKQLTTGESYLEINPKGQVPALRTPDGIILTEGPAVLQFIADQAPASGLAPPAGTMARYSLQQWLNYLSTEVHKAVFYMMFNPASPNDVKAFARDVLLPARYRFLSQHVHRGRRISRDDTQLCRASRRRSRAMAGAHELSRADDGTPGCGARDQRGDGAAHGGLTVHTPVEPSPITRVAMPTMDLRRSTIAGSQMTSAVTTQPS